MLKLSFCDQSSQAAMLIKYTQTILHITFKLMLICMVVPMYSSCRVACTVITMVTINASERHWMTTSFWQFWKKKKINIDVPYNTKTCPSGGCARSTWGALRRRLRRQGWLQSQLQCHRQCLHTTQGGPGAWPPLLTFLQGKQWPTIYTWASRNRCIHLLFLGCQINFPPTLWSN